MTEKIKNPVCTYFLVVVSDNEDMLSDAAEAIIGLGKTTKDDVKKIGDYIVVRADEIGDYTLIIPVTAKKDTSKAKAAIVTKLDFYFKKDNWTLTEYQVKNFHPDEVEHKKDPDKRRDRNAWG